MCIFNFHCFKLIYVGIISNLQISWKSCESNIHSSLTQNPNFLPFHCIDLSSSFHFFLYISAGVCKLISVSFHKPFEHKLRTCCLITFKLSLCMFPPNKNTLLNNHHKTLQVRVRPPWHLICTPCSDIATCPNRWSSLVPAKNMHTICYHVSFSLEWFLCSSLTFISLTIFMIFQFKKFGGWWLVSQASIWSALVNIPWAVGKNCVFYCWWVGCPIYVSLILLVDCILASFLSGSSLCCWEGHVEIPTTTVPLITSGSAVWCIHVWGCYVFLKNWSFCHYVRCFLVSSNFLCSEAYFSWY